MQGEAYLDNRTTARSLHTKAEDGRFYDKPPQGTLKVKATEGSDLTPLVFAVQTSCRRLALRVPHRGECLAPDHVKGGGSVINLPHYLRS